MSGVSLCSLRRRARSENLVGRAAELGSFGELLARLDAGSAAAVEISGEAGIGKTRLLAELASRADKRRDLVLTGSASELERDLPFWLFVDALDEYVQGLDPRRLAGPSTEERSELGTVLPVTSAGAPALTVATQDERYRSHKAIRSLLELLAVRQPVLLLLDDIHWADAGSVELLSTAVQLLQPSFWTRVQGRPRIGAPSLTVASYRVQPD